MVENGTLQSFWLEVGKHGRSPFAVLFFGQHFKICWNREGVKTKAGPQIFWRTLMGKPVLVQSNRRFTQFGGFNHACTTGLLFQQLHGSGRM